MWTLKAEGLGLEVCPGNVAWAKTSSFLSLGSPATPGDGTTRTRLPLEGKEAMQPKPLFDHSTWNALPSGATRDVLPSLSWGKGFLSRMRFAARSPTLREKPSACQEAWSGSRAVVSDFIDFISLGDR